ncbi:hypothetical protein [Nocardia tenerifensis]|uniref:hypothetical protein n=1 Tax=Nocardia tenerifensis TaxID=228006 RepID=UPI001B864561|nr:hypothetical protein [Nocardia tenerifensis]
MLDITETGELRITICDRHTQAEQSRCSGWGCSYEDRHLVPLLRRRAQRSTCARSTLRRSVHKLWHQPHHRRGNPNGLSSKNTSPNEKSNSVPAPALTAHHADISLADLRPDPAQRARLEEIRVNIEARIIEARREGWLGEVEGLQVSYSGVNDKLAQIDATLQRTTAGTELGIPGFDAIFGRTAAP